MPVAVAATLADTDSCIRGPMLIATTPEIMALSTARNPVRPTAPTSA